MVTESRPLSRRRRQVAGLHWLVFRILTSNNQSLSALPAPNSLTTRICTARTWRRRGQRRWTACASCAEELTPSNTSPGTALTRTWGPVETSMWPCSRGVRGILRPGDTSLRQPRTSRRTWTLGYRMVRNQVPTRPGPASDGGAGAGATCLWWPA